jgi:hypothetical protein
MAGRNVPGQRAALRRVAGRHDQLELVDDSGGDAPLARTKHVTADDGQVDLAIPHALLHRARVRDSQGHADPGVLRAKAGDPRGQHVRSGRGAGADHERSAREAVQLRDRLLPGGEGGHHPGGVVLEDASRFGQRDGAAVPDEEPDAQLVLQLAHVLGERGLRQVDALGGPAEAPGVGDGQEDLELADRHRSFSTDPI